jgi:hypothetical protein
VIAREQLTRDEYRARVSYLDKENSKWPEQMKEVPEYDWPHSLQEIGRLVGVWRSRHFLAQAFGMQDGAARLTVSRTEITREGDWRQDISWEELMSVKSQCGFDKDWAVEIFPPDTQIVNVANMRHLWITKQPEFAWTRR